MSNLQLPKLIAGSLLVGVSALSGTSLLATVASGIGLNWASESLGGVLPGGAPQLQPDSPLAAAYERALRRAVGLLRRAYQREHGRDSDVAAFRLVEECAGSVATAQAPAGSDLAAAQRELDQALGQLLHAHDERQVAWIRGGLLEEAATQFQLELASDDRAWRLFHGWLIQAAALRGAALAKAVADLPRVLAEAQRPELVLDQIDAASERLEAMLASLRAELRQAARAPAKIQTGGIDLSGAQIGTMGDVVAGDKITYIGALGAAVSAEAILATYMGGMISAASHLTMAEVGNADPGQREVLLEDVYTRLEVASGFPLGERESRAQETRLRDPQRQATALEALSHHGRLVLLGSPGAGKSTLTRFLALCLARAALGDPGWLERLGEGWTHGALLPVRVELSDLATWLAARDGEGGAALLWEYLAARAGQDALAPLLQERSQRGETLVILDGLDEIPTGPLLQRIVLLIEALAALPQPRLLLVTCRVLDYEEPARRLAGWPTETLIPFSDDLQQEFIQRWYATLRRLGRTLSRDPGQLAARLSRAVRERPDLRRLAGNPLLLTMMALLNATTTELPDKRVELYAQCLTLLLREWRQAPDKPALEARLQLTDWGRSDTDRLLDHLGFTAHSHEAAATGRSAETAEREGGALLTRDLLVLTAAQVFKSYGVGDPYGPAGRFCDYVGRYSNGVLQKHGEDAYRFPHRTFQEFLAARRLVNDRDWQGAERDRVSRLLTRATSAEWHEVLLLAISLLVVQGQARDIANLVEQLLAGQRRGSRAWAKRLILAAEVLAEAERKNLDAVGEGRLWGQITDGLCQILRPAEPGKPGRSTLDAAWRVRAGAALGRMGDPRPGVCTLAPDWCVVPAGPFLMGSGDADTQAYRYEKPQYTVDLPAFQISRYPLTNAQWQRFVDAGGYQEPRWWGEAGWKARQQEGWEQPAEWDNPRFGLPNQPVVGISWYEASAYCRWLSAELDSEVRLPSEAEWEKAARGTEGRIYPWGNTWDAERANTSEGGVGATTAVGCYPTGASPYGALDCAGNVLEWTATPWSSNYQDVDGTQQETVDGESFVWRGGAWSFDQGYARCASRVDYHPSTRYDDLGVRVVVDE